jgi:SAM domain (Sterile alpha motif)
MDLGGWLRSLGLGQYEAAFRENAIDDTVLPNLTAEDLKDLGVDIVGHRRKLLDAIAALRADASAKAPPPDALPATDITAKDTAERRQVTVMFSDLARRLSEKYSSAGGSQFLGPHVFSRPRDGARAELSVIKSDQYLFLLVVLGPNLLLLLLLLLCCPLLLLRQAHPSPRHLNQSIAPFLVFDRLR